MKKKGITLALLLSCTTAAAAPALPSTNSDLRALEQNKAQTPQQAELTSVQTEGNKLSRYIGTTDEPLCQEGTEFLHKMDYPKVQAVYVSPLKRCVQTAEILFPGAEQVVCEQMRECDFGLFEGKNYQELTGNPKYQSWIDSGGTKAFPGGEDPMEFRKRCVCGFEQMMEKMIKGKRKKIAFVVHGGTIMSVMEAFDPEKKEFYHWQVKNGKGFHFQIEEEKWQQGKRQFEEIEEI